jgi:LmeA-like phospholipid-binding
VTNPQGPPDDPTAWGRAGNQGPSNQPTQRIRGGQLHGGRPHDATQPGQLPGPTEQFGAPHANVQQPPYARPPAPPGPPRGPLATAKEEPATPMKKKRSLRDPLSLFLVLITVLALVVGGLIVAELIVRGKATDKIATAAACETKDSATAKFGVAPLVLWQLATKHYTNISVETAGNQLRTAKGMKLQLNINDIRLQDSPDSKGTIGSIDATVTWTKDGIKETITNSIPKLGKYVARSVTPHPNDNTVEMKGVVGDIVVKPVISNGTIRLQIISLNSLATLILSKEEAQKKLDEYTSDLHLPLGIQADQITVTPDAVVTHFKATNANIPANKTQDDCFKNL